MEMQSTGLITLPGKIVTLQRKLIHRRSQLGFLVFWGTVFIVSTTFVALFKHETDENYDLDEPHFGLKDTYKLLVKVLRLPSVRSMAFILFTAKVIRLVYWSTLIIEASRP
jgi:MFS transporter, PAT family, solute carrier family 33 (acetyl-CoA transportor), member 1